MCSVTSMKKIWLRGPVGLIAPGFACGTDRGIDWPTEGTPGL